MPGMNIAQAYVAISPSTKNMQREIAASLKGLGGVGESAGKDISSGVSKTLRSGLKGKGKAVGDELGTEFTGAVTRSMSGLKLGAVTGVFASLTTAALGSFSSIMSGAMSASDATDKFKKTLDFAGLDTAAIEATTAKAQEYADKTVYNLGDIQNMTAQLASNGIKDYTGLAEAAGNLNAIAGGNADTFKSVGMVMTQTAGAGKLTTENWNQLSDAIPGASGKVQEALRQAGAYTGNFRDAMAKGEITAEEFNAAVMQLGSEPVAVEAAKSVTTFEGALGNLQATIDGNLAQTLTALKPAATESVGAINDLAEIVMPLLVAGAKTASPYIQGLVESFRENAIPKFGKAIEETAPKLQSMADVFKQNIAPNLADTILPLAQNIARISGQISISTWQAFGDILNALAPVVRDIVVPALERIATFMQENPGKTAAVVGAFAAFKGVGLLISAATAPLVPLAGLLLKIGQGMAIAKVAGEMKILAGAVQTSQPALASMLRIGSRLGESLNPFQMVLRLIVEPLRAVISLIGSGLVRGLSLAMNAIKLLGAVIAANPVGAIVTGIGIAVAGLTWFFTQTETGRRLWDTFTSALSAAWETVSTKLSEGWAVISTLFAAGWETLKSVFFDLWETYIDRVKTNWETLGGSLSAAWEAIKSAYSAGWEYLKSAFFNAWEASVNGMATVWNNAIGALSVAWELVKSAFSSAWDYINTVVFEPFKAAINLVKAVFSGNTTAMSQAFEVFKQAIHNAIEAVKNRLTTMVDAFGQLPGRIKGAFAGAGSWLVDAGKSIIRGLADGVRNAAGMIEDAVRAVIPDSVERFVPGLHFGGIIPAFARGGVLPSVPGFSSSDRDPILGWSAEKKQPVARVEPGEFIVNREATKKYLPLLAAINGGKLNGKMLNGLPAFKDGGLLSSAQVKAKVKFMDGTPYLMGGWTSAATDCSGAVSGTVNVAEGGDFFAGGRMSTVTEGTWLAQRGYQQGKGSTGDFRVGWYDYGGGANGHTAMQLPDGTFIESGGSTGGGFTIGRKAGPLTGRGFTNFMFKSGTDSQAGSVNKSAGRDYQEGDRETESAIAKQVVDFGAAQGLFELAKNGIRLFDTGGLLRTGQLAFNAGPNEHVMSPYQWDKLVAGLTDLADAVKKGNFSYDWLKERFGKRTSDLAMEATGGALGGWTANTKLLQDAEKGLAEVRADSKAKAEDIAAAENTVIAARKASEARGFNQGQNIQAFWNNGTLSQYADVASQVGGFAKNIGAAGLGEAVSGLAGSMSTVLGASSKLKKAYEEQAEANAAVVGAEANLRVARASGDASNISEAENKLSSARSTAASVAASTGHVEIAAAIQVAGTVADVAKMVISYIDSIRERQLKAHLAQLEAYGQYLDNVAKISAEVRAQKSRVVELASAWVAAVDKVNDAIQGVSKAAAGILKAKFDGIKGIAEAQKKLTDAIVGTGSTANVYDMGLLWDSHSNQLTATPQVEVSEGQRSGGMLGQLGEIAGLQQDLLAAQIDAKLSIVNQQREMVKAQWDLFNAQKETNRLTADLKVAQARLVQLGQIELQFKMSEQQALILKQQAELEASNAKAQADKGSLWNRIGRALDFNGDGKTFGFNNVGSQKIQIADATLAANQKQLEQLKAVAAANGVQLQSFTAEQQKLIQLGGVAAAGGHADLASAAFAASPLGDAQRALDMISLQKSLNNATDEQTKLIRATEDLTIKMAEFNQLRPLNDLATALENQKAAAQYAAEASRADSVALREAALALRDFHSAEAAKPSTTVELTIPPSGSLVDADALAMQLSVLNDRIHGVDLRVSRVEDRPKQASAVLSRRS